MEQTKTRNVSLDLLRIVIMLYIVCWHCICHGQMSAGGGITGYNSVLLTLSSIFVNVHVNCFVLLSGYFLCEGSFKFRKLFSLYAQVWFWSVFLYAFFVITGYTPFGLKELVKVCLPFTQQQYWFFTTYLLMYVLSPFLNILIKAMDQKQHLTLLLVYFGVYVLLQNLVFWRNFTLVGSHDPMHFIFLYMAAAYLRRYSIQKKHHWGWIYIGSCLFVAVYNLVISYITTPIFGEPMGETAFSGYNSVFTVIGSIAFFAFFQNLKINEAKFGKVITLIAPLTFGVYLIHDNNFMRPFLWQTLLVPAQYVDSAVCIPMVIALSIGVFIVCTLFEYLRKKLFELLRIDRVLAKLGDTLDARCKQIIDKIAA